MNGVGWRASRVVLAAALAGVWLQVPASPRAPAQSPPREVNYDARKTGRGYHGPGRDEPDPKGLREVRIGYFGPADPKHPVGGSVWLGVSLAIEEANAGGGYKGLPFRLMPVWAENPWAGGVSSLARMAYEDRVWAVIGSIDGAATHLAEQVAAKALFPLMDPASTDRSVNLANVPWMFSCLPEDRAIAAAVGEAALENAQDGSVLISATDHDSRALAAEFLAYFDQRKTRPLRHWQFQPGSAGIAELAAQAAESRAGTVVVLAGVEDSAAAVRQLKSRRTDLRLLGGPAMARASCVARAGPAAEGVIVPLLVEPSAEAEDFAARWRKRFSDWPDYAAMQGYDAAGLLVAAIRGTGLNRARIRDGLQALSPWRGVAGEVRWDPVLRNARPVRLGIVQGGKVVPLSERPPR
jgi:ABC-type branched-subunit amino acid transport system substrate-binding protein